MLSYQSNGYLIPGIFELTWNEFVTEFGFNNHRLTLIHGLKIAIEQFKKCGCKCIYIDGSFVSKKITPNDYDACWDTNGVNLPLLKIQFPTLVDFSNSRQHQKDAYKGEFFPMTAVANPPKEIYFDFFQHDRDDNPKGIIKLTIS